MPIKRRFGPAEMDIDVSVGTSSAGKPCIVLEFLGVTVKLPLEDAETLAEAVVKCVRAAEAQET